MNRFSVSRSGWSVMASSTQKAAGRLRPSAASRPLSLRQAGDQRPESLRIDVPTGEDDADAPACRVRNLAVQEGGEGGGASGLDDQLHARGEEGHGRSQLQVAHREDALGEGADDGESTLGGPRGLEGVGSSERLISSPASGSTPQAIKV